MGELVAFRSKAQIERDATALDERLAEACKAPMDCASSPYAQQSTWRCEGCCKVLENMQEEKLDDLAD